MINFIINEKFVLKQADDFFLKKRPYQNGGSLLPFTFDYFFKILWQRYPAFFALYLPYFFKLFWENSVIEQLTFGNTELLPIEIPIEITSSHSQRNKIMIPDLLGTCLWRDVDGKTWTARLNVEAQRKYQRYIVKRGLSYAARVYGEQLSSGEDYEKCGPVLSIIFSIAKIFNDESPSKYFRTLSLRDDEAPHENMYREIHPSFVSLNAFRKTIPELHTPLDFLFYVVKHSDKISGEDFHHILTEGDPMTKQLVTNVLEVSKDTALRSLSLDFKLREAQELSELRYQQKQSEAKGMAQGMVKGMTEGMEKGMEKGRAEGITEGMEKGRAEGITEGQIITQKNIARQMLDHGATPDFVCKTSGLSAEAVAELVRERGKN